MVGVVTDGLLREAFWQHLSQLKVCTHLDPEFPLLEIILKDTMSPQDWWRGMFVRVKNAETIQTLITQSVTMCTYDDLPLYCDVTHGTPLQYSCLENPMDGGAWEAAVHGVAAEGRTRLSIFTFTFTFTYTSFQRNTIELLVKILPYRCKCITACVLKQFIKIFHKCLGKSKYIISS